MEVQELQIPHHVIRSPKQLIETSIKSKNERFHYYLECFHRYYDADFILQTVTFAFSVNLISKFEISKK